jgi:hypothetical protein
MSAEIIDPASGILTPKRIGKLTQPELTARQEAAGELINKQGKVEAKTR